MMVQKCKQEHEFSYLAKQYGNDYTFEVMEIPGIMIGGQDLDIMQNEIKEATKDFLKFDEDVHYKAQQKVLTSSLNTSDMGVVLDIVKFVVKCE